MSARIDRTGERYGHLVVQEMIYGVRRPNGRLRTYARCLCDCGNEVVKLVDDIIRSPRVSCSCMDNYYRKINNRTNEIGRKFGRLTIIDIDYDVKPRSVATCRCDCGNVIKVAKADVVSLHTQSCGCLQKEATSKANYVDSSGYVNEYGVRIIRPLYQNERGVWVYECECPECHNIFYALPAKVKNNSIKHCGCSTIRSSGEATIEEILTRLGVNYEKEYRIKECRNIYALPFDFAILGQDNNPVFFIEYDGQQHFKAIDFFGGDEGFKERLKHDAIKNKYCYDHKIPLYRISYHIMPSQMEKFIIDRIESLKILRDCDAPNSDIGG